MEQHALQTSADFGDVLPLDPETRKPLVAFDRATSDPDRIHEMWQLHPYAGIGLAAWAASLLIVDVEHPSKGNGDGFATLDALTSSRELGPLPPTRTHRTKSGGAHYVFSLPRGHSIRSAHHVLRGLDECAAEGIDIVTGRSVLRWPPTPGYTLEHGFDCEPLPDAWVMAVTDPPAPPRRDSPILADEAKRRHGLAAIDKEMTKLAAVSAQRNPALCAAAFNLGQLLDRISESEIEAALLTACEVNDSLREHGRRACLGTIRRQMRAGAQKPRRR